jgi:NAD(P)H-hydrate epimerase
MTEITSIGLPVSADGIIANEAMAAISDRLSRADAALIGCGMGREGSTVAFIRHFAETVEVPLVVDADGINALAGRTDLIRERSGGRWILTPHMGEFRRLAGDALERSGLQSDDRIRIAQHFARAWNCVLVLKGMPSIVAAPDGRAWIPSTGNPGLASAGTGDVLAGICVGLLAQGVSPVDAAVAGVHLGGACADRYAEGRDLRAMLATDLVDQLPFVLKERFPIDE